MCIILGKVECVSKTKLFVLANKHKTRQMTFYSNMVDTPAKNLMVLPVPVSVSVPGIQLHSITYPQMFTDLKRSVTSIYREESTNFYLRSVTASAIPRETLEVFDHGSYLVSIAPTLEDLFRLDTSVFTLTPELFQFFANHYTREFSYICCTIKAGTKQYEPLCYSHPIHSSKKLFVPTLHYHTHGGKIHTTHADWDHLIYSVGTEEKANRGYRSNYSNAVDWSKFPPDFQKLTVSSIRCSAVQGHYPNKDLAFGLY